MSRSSSPVTAGREASGDRDVAPPIDPPTASAVSITLKLPPFWPSDPELWFAQVEAQFSCRRITAQKSKFDHVVACLTPQFAAEVRDLLLKPPAESPYDQLKEQLTKRTTASEQRKLQLLFTGEELGDRKPTQLLRRMQQLLGDRPGLTDTSFLQELFLQRLPSNVRMVLASTPDTTPLEKLAEMADKVIEVAAPSIASVQSSASLSAGSAPNSATSAIPVATPVALSAEIEQLRQEIARLQASVKQLARSRSSSRSNTRPSRRPQTPPASTSNPTNSSSDSSTALCWYHRSYGDQAQKCRPPCAWQLNSQASY